VAGLAACGSEEPPHPGAIAFSARPDDPDAFGWQLFVADSDGTNVERLSNVDGDVYPDWSPDGRRVVYERVGDENSIRVVEGSGGISQWLADGEWPAWSPDGAQIAFTRTRGVRPSHEVVVIDADGTNERTLATNAARPVWSPDGEQVLFEQFTDGDEGHLAVMRGDGGDVRALTSTPGDSCAAWSPDGRRIAFCRGLSGGEVYVMDSDGSDVSRISNTGNSESRFTSPNPVWSPDGRRILYTRPAHDWELVVVDADGGSERVISPSPAPGEYVEDSDPVWSPDGKQIAFLNGDEIWVMNADGTGRRRLVKGPFTEPNSIDWGPATKE